MFRGGARQAAVACLALALTLTSCTSDEPGEPEAAGAGDPGTEAAQPTIDLPERPAPYDLTSITLPGNVDEVIAVMSRFPDTVKSMAQSEPVHGQGAVEVSYRPGDSPTSTPAITFRAVNLASPATSYPPGSTAGTVVDRAAAPGDDLRGAGVDDGVAWVHRVNSVSGSEQHELIFGELNGEWIFIVQAANEELLQQALEIFAAAAGN